MEEKRLYLTFCFLKFLKKKLKEAGFEYSSVSAEVDAFSDVLFITFVVLTPINNHFRVGIVKEELESMLDENILIDGIISKMKDQYTLSNKNERR